MINNWLIEMLFVFIVMLRFGNNLIVESNMTNPPFCNYQFKFKFRNCLVRKKMDQLHSFFIDNDFKLWSSFSLPLPLFICYYPEIVLLLLNELTRISNKLAQYGCIYRIPFQFLWLQQQLFLSTSWWLSLIWAQTF